MNKTKKIIAALLISLMVLSIAPISVWAKNQANQAVPVEKENTCPVQSSSVDKQSPSEVAAQKINRSKVMKALSLSSSNMQSFDIADYYESDIKYTAKFDDGSSIDFDKNLNIIAYCNFDRKSENSQISNENLINILKEEYHIDETYYLNISYEANENTAEDILYYWTKTETNGCRNPYDALSVRIDGAGNEIVIFNRFNDIAEISEIKITEAEAKRIALDVKEEFNKVTSCTKEYVKPNYYWTEEEPSNEKDEPIRLVYNVGIDNRYYVYVDAETGEVIGGDMTKGISK